MHGEAPPFFGYFLIARSPLTYFVFVPLSCPLCNIASPIVFTFSAVCYAAAALFSDSHRQWFCVHACVLMYVECVLSYAHKTIKKSGVFLSVFAKAAAQPRSRKNQYTAVQQQRYNGSRAPSSRLCASNHGVCVCG